ncbi:tRNA (adenine-N(6)-)-methyltransferase [Pasteurellaceae bacterium Pebbles2]|nr:tRNA (adenine-N(6)-)-methyltransferase [Pasteurellaceae bacterium Pebbles2]
MSSFRFKQFHIQQDKCAMKVGTDGILLGSWADIRGAEKILDLGTGTGLIALMLAQRAADAQIHAVEIDPAAWQQAKENVTQSPWANRIELHLQDIAEFAQKCGEKNNYFDLIVANPPYFKPSVACRNEARNLARYTQTHNHLDWLKWAEKILSPQGKIQFILPFDAAETLLKHTALWGKLHCEKRCDIITKQGKPPQRMLLSFNRTKLNYKLNQLVIYDENNQYTKEFVALTKEFYLKM